MGRDMGLIGVSLYIYGQIYATQQTLVVYMHTIHHHALRQLLKTAVRAPRRFKKTRPTKTGRTEMLARKNLRAMSENHRCSTAVNGQTEAPLKTTGAQTGGWQELSP